MHMHIFHNALEMYYNDYFHFCKKEKYMLCPEYELNSALEYISPISKFRSYTL